MQFLKIMARFSVGRDEDGNEEGPSRNRPLKKKPRCSAFTPYSSGDTGGASTSADPQPPAEQVPRPDLPPVAEVESEEESEDESGTSSNSSQEESGERSGEGVPPTEPRVSSNPDGIGPDRESVGGSTDSLEPVFVALTDPDVLDCPVCIEPLSSPVFQCENGHIACASCCIKMMNKCASCSLPIGYMRNRAIEKVLESVRIPCRNMQHGCTRMLSCSKKLDHEKACNFAPFSCPHRDCNYVGMYKNLYAHFATQHSRSSKKFFLSAVTTICLDRNQKHVFLQERQEKTLFILSRSIEPFGSCINIVCIAPTSTEFRCFVVAQAGDSSIKLEAVVEGTPQWNPRPPSKKYLPVPSDFTSLDGKLTLGLMIWRNS